MKNLCGSSVMMTILPAANSFAQSMNTGLFGNKDHMKDLRFFSNPLLGNTTKVSVSPDKVQSESYNTFTFTIVLGEDGLAKGESIGIVSGSNIDRWQFSWPDQMWGCQCPWQTERSQDDNYITARCSNSDAELELKVGELGGFKPYCNERAHLVRSLKDRLRYVLEIKAGSELRPGDVITVTWGDKREGSEGVKAPITAMKYYFMPFRFSLLPALDSKTPVRRGGFDMLPSITVAAKSAVRLYVTAQPFVQAGKDIEVKISALDEYFSLDENFSGDIKLTVEGENETITRSLKMSAADKGSISTKLKINKTGWFKAKASSKNINGYSNYIIAGEEEPENKVYFGDMHCHTLDCDATVPREHHFEYARSAAGLDFISVSCHASHLGSKQAWDNLLDKTELYHEPGSFVTFAGYEWAGDGHCNAYFVNTGDAELFYNPALEQEAELDDPKFRTPVPIPGTREKKPGKPYFVKGVIDFLEAVNKLNVPAFVIGHCHTRYQFADDNVMWLFEMHTTHQVSDQEKRFQQFVGAAGKYFGVCGGSDNHRLPAGSMMPNPGEKWPNPFVPDICYNTAGLQATFANNLTRESLYEGMKARHCYGTNGCRMVISFNCGGAMMGDKTEIGPGQKPRFSIKVGGTAPLKDIVLWKYSSEDRDWIEAEKFTDIGSDRWEAELEDEKFSSDAIYYLRAVQADGGTGWSSPIWAAKKA
ncbi:DUF3604 domain-containing protein [Limihaloglobus sulfuriphilus]|nr:DUF3604 domain-containing protein [Limihaloglobus sulfuriphilus]